MATTKKVANDEISAEEMVIIEQMLAEIEADYSSRTPEEIEELMAMMGKSALIADARDRDDVVGFAAFYELVHGIEVPKHALRWVEEVYKAKEEGKKGTVTEAFRGSTKTTTVTITFTAFRIGKDPERFNLLIQIGDDTASDNSEAIADIIENNTAFKLVFPNVVPDKKKGWGAGGYEVMRNDMEYEVWREMNSKRLTPSLLGVGYKSGEIIGKHPDGLLIVDDIHDENNTSSARELAKVLKILTGTIFPTMTKVTWGALFIGTPWVENDALQYVASTGEFLHTKTPVYRENGSDKREYTWEEVYDEKEIDSQRALAGTLEFARMFLLDLTAAHNKVFKYMGYPNSEVRFNWPMAGGVDYASNRDAAKSAQGKGDYFAMAYVAKLPGGGCVVVDGVLDRCTQGQAEAYVVRAQEIFHMWLISGVESVGKGDDFIQTIMRNPGLRISPQHSGRMRKERRLEVELAPWLENGTVRISDAETPFLRELRNELDSYPNNAHDDALDAVYYALRVIPDVLVMPQIKEELPEVFIEEKKKASIWELAKM